MPFKYQHHELSTPWIKTFHIHKVSAVSASRVRVPNASLPPHLHIISLQILSSLVPISSYIARIMTSYNGNVIANQVRESRTSRKRYWRGESGESGASR